MGSSQCKVVDVWAKGENADMSEIERIVFKLCCYYHAKTELYDRTLTYERSRHDPTEAYLDYDFARSFSNKYALKLREEITDFAERVLKMQRSDFRKMFKEQSMCHYSAQGWIDLYNHLEENGEMGFLYKRQKPVKNLMMQNIKI